MINEAVPNIVNSNNIAIYTGWKWAFLDNLILSTSGVIYVILDVNGNSNPT